MAYTAPIKDLWFGLTELVGLHQLVQSPPFQDADLPTVSAVLEECAVFAQEVLAPLNQVGDRAPPQHIDGQVSCSAGFKNAYAQFAAAGWQGVQHPTEWGGQGLPKVVSAACVEMINSANLSFALCPLLTDGAIEALLTAGSPQQQQRYIPSMMAGTWTGTMNLTEPQAGSDLGAVRTRAQRQTDASYRIFGTKIYITYGDHDLAENIIHLVLARIEGAPEGVKGLSLFIVPKYRIQPDGTLGERNDVRCVSLEHKLGIKASPTAVMQYGDNGGAWAELVGQENAGLAYMFIMMNAARFGVGVQGLAMAQRAYGQAVDFARQRVQGRSVSGNAPPSVAIIEHPDVKRMLLTMRALTEGCRALILMAAAEHDKAHDDSALYEWMVPIVKGFVTEVSQEVVALALQVHGGMGYIEDTGVAQHVRDAKILTIYEGTTAIQANDFVGRKTWRDKGAIARSVAAAVEQTEHDLTACHYPDATKMQQCLAQAREKFLEALDFMLAQSTAAAEAAYAGSVPFLMMAGYMVTGWQMARAWLVAHQRMAEGTDKAFMQAKIHTARFYADHLLVRMHALHHAVTQGAASVCAMSYEGF